MSASKLHGIYATQCLCNFLMRIEIMKIVKQSEEDAALCQREWTNDRGTSLALIWSWQTYLKCEREKMNTRPADCWDGWKHSKQRTCEMLIHWSIENSASTLRYWGPNSLSEVSQLLRIPIRNASTEEYKTQFSDTIAIEMHKYFFTFPSEKSLWTSNSFRI